MSLGSILRHLGQIFPWFFPLLQSFLRLVSSTVTEIGSLVFHNPNPGDDDHTPDELFVSDELSPLDKLANFSKSDLVIHRLFVLRDLENIVKELSFQETSDHVLPVLKLLCDDVEPVVRGAAVERLPLIAQHLAKESDKGREILVNKLLQINRKVVVDKNVQTQASAHDSFVKICSFFKQQELDEILFPLLCSFLSDINDEDLRVEGLALFKDVTPFFAAYGLVWKIIPKIVENCSDPAFRVRKGCVEAIAALCEHLDQQIVLDRLLSLYLELCKDKIWGVRKACAVALPAVAKSLNAQTRATTLMDTFQLLSTDFSRWVKTSLLENLGPFIASFLGDPEVPFTLIENFEMMASGDPELVLSCAFNFPAVVLTLGPKEWPRLRSTFLKLSSDMQWKTRRTLSYSLHEIAKIIGPDHTEEDLAPVFDLYLRDLDDVKIGVITNYAKFLSQLRGIPKEMFLRKIMDLQNHSEGWRFREILARQVPILAELCQPEELTRFLVPESLNFCKDPVNVVRLAAIPGVCHVLKALQSRGNQASFEKYVEELQLLGNQNVFSGRQFYALLCGELTQVLREEDFATLFFPLLVTLSSDPIVNVRLVVAETLRQKVSQLASLQQSELLLSTLERLRVDKDRDVCRAAS